VTFDDPALNLYGPELFRGLKDVVERLKAVEL
jgi:hypothetical protein